MPRLKTDIYWVERVKSLTANSRLGPLPITKMLLQEANDQRRNDSPAERTVARLQAGFRGTQEEEEYRFVRWPEVCERGDLPWEASRTVLELLGSLSTSGLGRPPLSLARAFWRVTLARPEMSTPERLSLAHQLDAASKEGGSRRYRVLEYSLTHAREVTVEIGVLHEETDIDAARMAASMASVGVVRSLKERKPVGPPDWDFLFSQATKS